VHEVWVIGAGLTAFGRHAERSHRDLAAEALREALADAGGVALAERIEAVMFGSCGLHAWGQRNAGGQVLLQPLVAEGLLPAGLPITNLEGGCATGAMAVHTAAGALRGGQADVVLALGVDKPWMPHDLPGMGRLFEGVLDQLGPEPWRDHYAEVAAAEGLELTTAPGRIALLDVAALSIRWHMRRHGTRPEHLAASAAKNHAHGALNPRAHHRKPMSAEQVLADVPVLEPLTRSMCAPISDGAAAALLVSRRALEALPAATRERAVPLRSSALVGGRRRGLADEPVSARAARRAYAQAGVGPEAIDVAELHDATSFGELQASECLGFCPQGQGGPYVASGAAALGGRRPANTSGGLVSKGHPLAASGLAMLHEVCAQLRGEAGSRQVPGARTGLVHNAGGLVGVDEALCGVLLLGR
jgi:acetyl-CoA acetyltransferase